MSKHTPRPWKYEPEDMTIRTMDFKSNAGMADYRGVVIAELDAPNWRQCRPDSIPEKEANGAFIVKACNCHDDLLAALTRLTEKVERANSIQHSGGGIMPEDWSELYTLQNEARAAIAKAKGE